MKIIDYIRKNPKKTRQYLFDILTVVSIVIAFILAETGELLPAGIVSILGLISKIANTREALQRIDLRDEIIEKETGRTVNQNLGIDPVELPEFFVLE